MEGYFRWDDVANLMELQVTVDLPGPALVPAGC